MWKRAVKRTIAATLPASPAGGVRVLLYHAIAPPSPEDRLSLRVVPDAFRAQMEWLRDEGYHVVPLRSLIEEMPRAARGLKREIAITFDDGYASQLDAAEILASFGFPATFFLVTRFLDGDASGAGYWERWGYFGWDEAKQLAARGFEIGSHSASHPEALARCAPEALRRELAGSKARLEAELGVSVRAFSYPHGSWSREVQSAVQAAGFQLACSSLAGVNGRPLSHFALRRTEMTGSDTLSDFQQRLMGKYDWVGRLHRWRAAHA